MLAHLTFSLKLISRIFTVLIFHFFFNFFLYYSSYFELYNYIRALLYKEIKYILILYFFNGFNFVIIIESE